MTDIARHIEYLLLEHDRVSIPQLGTFSIQVSPSRWVQEEDLFLPPVRNVSFTSDCDEPSCNHFVQSLSAALKVSDDQVLALCAEYVESIQQELSANSVAEVGSIGMFVRDSVSDDDCFIPCQAGVTSPQYYGLDSVYQPRLSECLIHNERVATLRQQEQQDNGHVTIRIPRSLLYYASATAAAIIIFLSFSTPASFTSPESASMAATTNLFLPDNLLPSVESVQEIWQADAPDSLTVNAASQTASQMSADGECEVPESEEVSFETASPSASETTQAHISVDKKQIQQEEYAVVLASAVSVSNAERYVTDLNEKGIKAVVRVNGSMNRVLVPGFKSRDDAAEYATTLRVRESEFEFVWVLKL
ncbi:MAG: SPOR domain-containing protein [Bacteroidaceae bacterium]